MKINESENDLLASYINGLAYTMVLAIILILFCYTINENWFDSIVTIVLITIICLGFFISGFKRVEEKNIGFLRKLGRRDFEETYSEGLWWIFPLWSFKQKPHFDNLNEAEELQVKFITSDEIPLDINVKYYWQLKNIKDSDNKYSPSYIKNALIHEIGIFVRNHQSMELLSDEDISNKVLIKFLVRSGDKIGVTISDIFPNINYESQYYPIVRKYQEKYKGLQFQLDKMLKHQQIKESDLKLYENQIVNCIKNLGFSTNESLSFIKIYKTHINLNESTYNVNVSELNKLIDSVIPLLNK